MSLIPFGTRLPESKLNYIRHKALTTKNGSIQKLMVEIIDFYQQHDSEFMAKFATLSNTEDNKKADPTRQDVSASTQNLTN